MELSLYPITILIIAATVIISLMAFNNRKLIDDLIFYPPAITNQKQWYRFVTCGFIHADFMHLAFNMFSLYAIGRWSEVAFAQIFGSKGWLLYVCLYLTALIVCLLPTYFKNKENYFYRSLGASGAVSAVIFVFMCQFPSMELRIFPIPFGLPGFIFGPLYLIITSLLERRGRDNINHSAHFWGAIYGVAFYIFAAYLFSDFDPIQHMVDDIGKYFASKF